MAEQEKHVILEVGPRYRPITKFDIRKNSDNYFYTVIDNNVENLITRTRPRTGLEMLGDLKQLPFRSDSINEIWLVNVFGQVYSDFAMDNLQLSILGLRRKTEPDNWDKYFEELARVLKSDGKICIVETLSPPTDYLLAKRDLSRYGLSQKAYYDEDIQSYFHKIRMPLAFKELFEFPYGRVEVGKPFLMHVEKTV